MANSKAATKIEKAIKILEKKRGKEFNAAGIAFARKTLEIIRSSKELTISVDATTRTLKATDIRVSKTRIDFNGDPKFNISLTHMREGDDVLEAEVYDASTDEYSYSPVSIEQA